MKNFVLALVGMMMIGCVSFESEEEMAIGADESALSESCWGQATAVFAATGYDDPSIPGGTVGEHSSQQQNPRMGLKNLAVYLYSEGVIEDDSMAALGQFVASALGMSIDACMD